MAVRNEGKSEVFSMIEVLHEIKGDVGFLPRTTEYITFIVEKGSSFFVTVGYFRWDRRKCLAKV